MRQIKETRFPGVTEIYEGRMGLETVPNVVGGVGGTRYKGWDVVSVEKGRKEGLLCRDDLLLRLSISKNTRKEGKQS